MFGEFRSGFPQHDPRREKVGGPPPRTDEISLRSHEGRKVEDIAARRIWRALDTQKRHMEELFAMTEQRSQSLQIFPFPFRERF